MTASFIRPPPPDPWANTKQALRIIEVGGYFLPGPGPLVSLGATATLCALEPSRENVTRLGLAVAHSAVSHASQIASKVARHCPRRGRALAAFLRAG